MSFPISITWSGGAPPVAGFQQMADAANKLNAALATSAGNMSQFGGTISQLESPLSSVGSSMGELSGNMQGLDSSLGSSASAMGEFAGSTEQLNGAVSETGGFINEASGSMDQFGTSATDAGSSATEFGTATTDASTGVTELGTASGETGGFVTELGTATGETNTVLGETNTVLSETAPIMAETGTATGDLAQGFTDLAPQAEASNTVIGDSVSILEGAGTAAEGAAGSTDTFSGALGGLNTEIEPVNGGLTDTNTLVGDVGGAADTTSGSTDTLSGSMTTLGTGIGAVTGSALTLYSAFTNVRDAQAGVERAQIKVIDANRKAETSYNTLNRAINKITSDTENNISGQARLAAAQAKLNALWDAGIRSGPQFAAAITELKGAQEGLTSSTTKGNEIIAKLGPNIAAVESTSRKAATSQLGLTRANEGLVESFLGIAGSVISGVSGLTQIATQGGKVVQAFGPLKGVFTGIAGALSSSLVPALGAIAVPAAAAGAAIGAFVGAVTLIRARMGDVDAFGKKVGEVFPAMKGFLDTARQAFINLSDGVNTAISTVLGGFDSLTGGVLGAQKAWDSWTGKLSKGTGQMGLAGQAANIAAVNMSKLSDRTNIGAGKWRELDGQLFKTNGTLKTTDDTLVATGHAWDVAGDGTAFYVKQNEKVPPANQKTTQTTNQMSEAMKKAAEELTKIGTATEEANAKLTFYSQAAKMAELINASFALGVAEAQVALIDENAELAKGAGALQVYSQQLADGSLQALSFKQGILEAGMALVEQVRALEQAKGAFEANNVLMQEGTLLAVEFATGVQETKTAIQEETRELANLAGQLAAYTDETTAATAIANAFAQGLLKQRKAAIDAALGYAEAVGKLTELQNQMKSGTSAVIAFNTGLVTGKTKALEFALSLAESVGESIAFEAALRKMAVAAGVTLQSALGMSKSQLEDLLGAMAMAPEAVNKVISAFDKMGQKIVDSLSKAAREGSAAFMKEIDKLQSDLGVTFSKPLIQKLQVEADIETAKQQVQGLLGILATTLRNQPLAIALKTDAAQQALALLQQKIKEAPAGAQAAFAPLQSALNKLGAWQPSDGMNKLPGILAEILIGSQNLEGGMQGAITGFNGLLQSVAASAGGLDQLKASLAAAGLTLNTTTGQITDGAGKIVASLGTIGPAAAGMGAQTVTALDTLGPAGTRARTTLAFELVALEFLMNRFAQEVKQSAIEVSTAFANMSVNTNTSLQKIASGILIMIAALPKVGSASQSMATTVSGSFSNMASNTIASMNRMASGLQIMIAAFPRLTSEANRTNAAVSSAMSQMASRAATAASGIQSSMSRISSSMSQAESRARSLASAINALRSKTITITTVYVTIRRTLFAAKGGAFVTSSPTNVGPLNVSEFGQRELVTVTPLEGPGRQPVKGLGDLLGKETEKKAKRGMAAEMEGGPSKKKEVVMMRELPIVITVDGREIARVVNKRIFEESDALV